MGHLTAAPNRQALLVADGVSKTYLREGRPVPALDRVSLSLGAGSVLCLVGPNGSGKTTLLKTLAGLVLPDEGTTAFGGLRLGGLEGPAASLTGLSLGEERSFYGPLSLLENLRFFARLRDLGPAALSLRLRELEPALRLEGSMGTTFQRAPSGVKSRLSLCRALLHRPRLLLLDEPTRSLDPEAALRVRGLIRKEYAGAGDRLAVWTTHRLEEAWETGTHIGVLHRGRMDAFGTPAELLDKSGAETPAEAYRRLQARSTPPPAAGPPQEET